MDRFRTVVLDLKGVESIGQAFADEVFRVFPAEHPETQVLAVNARSAVKRMISRARSSIEAVDDTQAPAGDDDLSLL